jgi:hypothetical protein
MQFQVPQFIETEDKIVGPLTLRQFLYLGAAAGLSVILYFTVQLWLWFIFSLFLAAIGGALAFIKVNGQPMVKIVIAAARFGWQPKLFVWQPEHPSIPKNEATLKPFFGKGLLLENIVAGLSLKKAHERVLTGTKASAEKSKRLFYEAKERYEIVRQLSGARRAVRRVDYR